MHSLRHPDGIDDADRTTRLSNQLASAGFAVLIAVALIALLGLYWTTRQSDLESIDRQSRAATRAIDSGLDDLAVQQETVAVWDETASMMAAAVPDQSWLQDNIGLWLHNMFDHDMTFLLDGDDQAVQASIDGKAVASDAFNPVASDLAPLIAELRRPLAESLGRHDRRVGRQLAASSTVRTTERATHVTRLALIDGRPAAISAMLITSSTPNYVRFRGPPPAMVSVQFIDSDFLTEIGKRHLLDGARVSSGANPGPSESAVPLTNEAGQRLGYLIWSSELPGSRILRSVLPGAALVIVMLAILMWFVTRRLKLTLRERSALELQAAHLAYHDSLTGLPNRELLRRRMITALDAPERGTVPLILIDLDRFKHVNDTLGHLAGDQLIRELATRLPRLIGADDVVARLGGDEFAILLSDRWQRPQVGALCNAILKLFEQPFELFNTRVFGGASVGIAFADKAVDGPTELMRRADVALYRAKSDGRGCSRSFEPAMDDCGKGRAQLESDLRQAVVEQQFEAWTQSLISSDNRLVGREVLLRWKHRKRGAVSPQEIIPLAEDTGLIMPIGALIANEAALISVRSPGLFTAVNLSPVQLRQPDFANELIEIFDRAGANRQMIELEVTEGVLLEENWAARANLKHLRKAGFKIALDDFGTGYSSLSYLRRFVVDKIKIDRSFVRDVQRCGEARAIVAAIVGVGRALGLTVTAEGIETAEQAEIMISAGCDELQGFYFGEPAPFEQQQEPMLQGLRMFG